MTRHAINRSMERTSLNENASIKLITRASRYGKKAEDFPKLEREYMLSKESSQGSKLIYYSGYLFAMSPDGACRTVMNAPTWFNKHNFRGKDKIRNKVAYARMYPTAC